MIFQRFAYILPMKEKKKPTEIIIHDNAWLFNEL